MDSCYKALPKLVSQTYDTSCWAAVLESWIGILPGRTWRPKESDLIDMYPDKTYPDGSVIPSELSGDIEYLAGKLSSKGHLVIGYNRGRRGGHVVVCYGVGRPTGGEQLVSVMDPSGGEGYKNRSLSAFNPLASQGNKIFIGWPKAGLDPKYF